MLRLRRLILAQTWVAMGIALSSTGVLAQDAQRATDEPTLPEVKVEVTPLPTGNSPDSVFNNGNFTSTPGAPPTITQNSIFGSPPTQGYRATSSTTGTIVNVPDIQLPASVSVVTNEVLHDQQALRINDVFRDVAGAAKLGDQLRPDSFILRGFEVASRNYRKNGLLDPTYTPRDFANVERIEILKGPSSILYGASQPSGTVNLITKKPLNDDFTRWTSQFGSFNFQRHTIDANGKVNDDGNVLFRVNAAYENSDGFRDFGYNEREFVAPSVSWLIDEDTAI
ncbi:MAG: TonB-dependent receptor plug domain-containing protein, partial [Planctomycetaceae bacterium]|nr:TonB-dependent receptor plug domain-containing protein [Planctomycetaceae bacterium]